MAKKLLGLDEVDNAGFIEAVQRKLLEIEAITTKNKATEAEVVRLSECLQSCAAREDEVVGLYANIVERDEALEGLHATVRSQKAQIENLQATASEQRDDILWLCNIVMRLRSEATPPQEAQASMPAPAAAAAQHKIQTARPTAAERKPTAHQERSGSAGSSRVPDQDTTPLADFWVLPSRGAQLRTVELAPEERAMDHAMKKGDFKVDAPASNAGCLARTGCAQPRATAHLQVVGREGLAATARSLKAEGTTAWRLRVDEARVGEAERDTLLELLPALVGHHLSECTTNKVTIIVFSKKVKKTMWRALKARTWFEESRVQVLAAEEEPNKMYPATLVIQLGMPHSLEHYLHRVRVGAENLLLLVSEEEEEVARQELRHLLPERQSLESFKSRCQPFMKKLPKDFVDDTQAKSIVKVLVTVFTWHRLWKKTETANRLPRAVHAAKVYTELLLGRECAGRASAVPEAEA